MPVMCSLIQHGFLPVFSMVVKIMLYSNEDMHGYLWIQSKLKMKNQNVTGRKYFRKAILIWS